MAKLISVTQLKSALKGMDAPQLVQLIADMSKNCPQAREYLTVKFASVEDAKTVLEVYKKKVKNEFFPDKGFGRLRLKDAKKAISDFKSVCSDARMKIDIILVYVENCLEFTAAYGDINEPFYNSAESMYAQAVKDINAAGEDTYEYFAARLKRIAEGAIDGWGFRDNMQ